MVILAKKENFNVCYYFLTLNTIFIYRIKCFFFCLLCWKSVCYVSMSVCQYDKMYLKKFHSHTITLSHPSKLLDWTFWHHTGRNLCLADDTTAPGFCGLGFGWTEWPPSRWGLCRTVPAEKLSLERCPVQCQEQIYLWNYVSIGLVWIKYIHLTK